MYQFAFDIFLQRDSVVMQAVVCAVNERHDSVLRSAENSLQRLRIRVKFSTVPLLEFDPFTRVMIEPPAQGRTRRDILQPIVNVQRGFLDTARP